MVDTSALIYKHLAIYYTNKSSHQMQCADILHIFMENCLTIQNNVTGKEKI